MSAVQISALPAPLAAQSTLAPLPLGIASTQSSELGVRPSEVGPAIRAPVADNTESSTTSPSLVLWVLSNAKPSRSGRTLTSPSSLGASPKLTAGPLVAPRPESGRANQVRAPPSTLAHSARPPSARMPKYGPNVPAGTRAMAAAERRGAPGGGWLGACFGASGAFARMFASPPPQPESERTRTRQAENGIRTGRASYQNALESVAGES